MIGHVYTIIFLVNCLLGWLIKRGMGNGDQGKGDKKR